MNMFWRALDAIPDWLAVPLLLALPLGVGLLLIWALHLNVTYFLIGFFAALGTRALLR